MQGAFYKARMLASALNVTETGHLMIESGLAGQSKTSGLEELHRSGADMARSVGNGGVRGTGLAGFARLAEGPSGSGWALAACFWP